MGGTTLHVGIVAQWFEILLLRLISLHVVQSRQRDIPYQRHNERYATKYCVLLLWSFRLVVVSWCGQGFTTMAVLPCEC